MKDQLLVVASRIAKLLVTGVCAWVLVHYKLDAPEWLRQAFEEAIAFGIASGALGLAAHFGIALKANPMDAVSPTEARRGRQQKRARKALRNVEERVEKAGLTVGEGEDPEAPKWFREPHNHD
jgi:hypothetical protein